MRQARPALKAISRVRGVPKATSRVRPALKAISRVRIGAAVAGAGVVALLVLATAAPAYAATASVAIATPSSGQVLKSTSAAISGTANIGAAALETNYVSDLSVAVNFESTAAGSCDAASCGANVGATTDASTSFSYTPPAFVKNGPYSASATVTAKECSVGGLLGCVAHTATATTDFAVAVPPVAPRDVKAVVNSDGSVTVSWEANPEPDVIGYQVQRQNPGSTSLVAVDNTEGTSWTDTSTAANGGDYNYVVTAFRPGSDGTAKTVLDTSSSAAAADVPVPVVTTPPTDGQVGTGATTTTLPASVTSGGANITSFLDQAQAAGALPAVPKVIHATVSSGKAVASSGSSGPFPSQTAPGPPNTYAPTLPYAGSAPLTGSAAGSGSRVPLAGAGSSGGGHSLVYSIAGGVLLCLLGGGLWIANKRSGAPPLEPLDEFGAARAGAGGAGAAEAGGGVGGTGSAGVRGTQSTGVVIVPASVAAKAAAREAARRAWADANRDILANAGAAAGVPGNIYAAPGAGAVSAADGGATVDGQGPGSDGLTAFAGGSQATGAGAAASVGAGVAAGAGAGVAAGADVAPADRSKRGRRRRSETAGAGGDRSLDPAALPMTSDTGSATMLVPAPGAAAASGSVGASGSDSAATPSLDAAPPTPPTPPTPPAPPTPEPSADVASAPAPVEAPAVNSAGAKPNTALAAHPSVEEAVDYFRLIRSLSTPAQDADKVEVPSPAG